MKFLLKVGKLVVGNGTVLRDVSVQIRGERIVEVGTDLSLDSDTKILDFSDRVVMPGIIDTHVHVCHEGGQPNPTEMRDMPDEYLAIRGAKKAETLLKHGVTTVGDAAARGEVSLAVRRAVNTGLVNGPRFLVCGRMITITGGRDRIYGPIEADGPDEVRKAVRAELARGVDFIKLAATGAISSEKTESLITQFTQEEMSAACEEAQKVGVKVHAHSYGDDGNRNTIMAGVDVLVHSHPLSTAMIRLMNERGTLLMPTLVTYYESKLHHHEGLLPDYMIRKEKEIFPLIEAGFREAVSGNIEIVVGSDSGMPYTPFGKSSSEELELMVKLGGMSELEAITAGTLNAARALGVEKETGSIEPGKSADLLVLSKGFDPLSDITALQQREAIENVYLRGRCVIKN